MRLVVLRCLLIFALTAPLGKVLKLIQHGNVRFNIKKATLISVQTPAENTPQNKTHSTPVICTENESCRFPIERAFLYVDVSSEIFTPPPRA
jgi:hypothetical protein